MALRVPYGRVACNCQLWRQLGVPSGFAGSRRSGFFRFVAYIDTTFFRVPRYSIGGA
jgi:hypothetical protein